MTKMLEAALTYAQMGLPIFPCAFDKKPLVPNGVHAATLNPDMIKKWWTQWPDANIGCHLGEANLMAYDLDPGSDIDALAAAVGGLPHPCPVQHTPRGGTHIFFEVPNGIKIAPSTGKISPHVDIRSYGSYVLLAPSRTEDGEYVWGGDSISHLTRCPMMTGEMVATAQIAIERHPERDNWIIEPDLDENIIEAVAWLEGEAKIATEHQDGDHTAYATAAMMRSFGLSEDKAVQVMVEFWDPRNNPPWGAEAWEYFRVKVENAYHYYATSPPGNMTAAYRKAKQKEDFKIRTRSGTDDNYILDLFRVAYYEDIQHIKQPPWLVHDMIPEGGHCLMYGSFSTFKTFLAFDIALPIAVSRPVVFFAGEGRSSINQRIQAWVEHHEKVPSKIVVIDPVPALLHQEKHEGLAKALYDRDGPYALAVFDTVGRAMLGGNENSQEDAARYTAMLGLFARELHCATLSIHHSGKVGSTSRGSSVFPADADTVIRVEADERLVLMHMVKQKDAEAWVKPRRKLMVKVGPSLVCTEPPAGTKRSNLEREQQANREDIEKYIYNALRTKHPCIWSVKALSEAIRGLKGGKDVASMTALAKILKNKGGWAPNCNLFAEYRDEIGEKWVTPGALPALKAGMELPLIEA